MLADFKLDSLIEHVKENTDEVFSTVKSPLIALYESYELVHIICQLSGRLVEFASPQPNQYRTGSEEELESEIKIYREKHDNKRKDINIPELQNALRKLTVNTNNALAELASKILVALQKMNVRKSPRPMRVLQMVCFIIETIFKLKSMVKKG